MYLSAQIFPINLSIISPVGDNSSLAVVAGWPARPLEEGVIVRGSIHRVELNPERLRLSFQVLLSERGDRFSGARQLEQDPRHDAFRVRDPVPDIFHLARRRELSVGHAKVMEVSDMSRDSVDCS